MAERKKITNESDGDILISIHQFPLPPAKASGAQVFYYKASDEGKKLAEYVQQSLIDTL